MRPAGAPHLPDDVLYVLGRLEPVSALPPSHHGPPHRSADAAPRSDHARHVASLRARAPSRGALAALGSLVRPQEHQGGKALPQSTRTGPATAERGSQNHQGKKT